MTQSRVGLLARLLPCLAVATSLACSVDNPKFLGESAGEDASDSGVDTDIASESGDASADGGDGDGDSNSGDGDGDTDSNTGDTDTDTDTSNPSSSTSTVGDGDGDCAPDAECRAVPDGWLGFFAFADLEQQGELDTLAFPGCGALGPNWNQKYDVVDVEDFDPGCDVCDCDANDANTECEDSNGVSMDIFASEQDCTSTNPSIEPIMGVFPVGECSAFTATEVTGVNSEIPATIVGPPAILDWTCAANPQDLVATSTGKMCAHAGAECDTGAGSGKCVTPPTAGGDTDYRGGVCIYQNADSLLECPVEYPVRFEGHDLAAIEQNDQRMCSSCGCEQDPANIYCEAFVTVHASFEDCISDTEIVTYGASDGSFPAQCTMMPISDATPVVDIPYLYAGAFPPESLPGGLECPAPSESFSTNGPADPGALLTVCCDL